MIKKWLNMVKGKIGSIWYYRTIKGQLDNVYCQM